jgi:hypothetical protein
MPSGARLEGKPASLQILQSRHNLVKRRIDLGAQQLCGSRYCDTDERGNQTVLNGGNAVFVSDEGLHSGKDRFHNKLHMVVKRTTLQRDFPEANITIYAAVNPL